MADEGKGAKEIKDYLEKTQAESHIYIMVDTLEYLKKGGRITPAVAALGTLFHIKPVLQIQGDKLDSFAKVRTLTQAKSVMMDRIEKDLNELGDKEAKNCILSIAHTQNRKEAEIFREEVREMCSSDRCRSFGKSWSCPPAVGDLAVIRKRAERFRSGIVVQTCGDIQSSFDTAAMHAIMKAHKKNFDTLVRQIRFFYPECLPMGAGACDACRTCTYPDRPCRHPERMYISMEAYGLLVSDVAESSGLHYNYGDNKMTFTSCILTD
jgi:predicted metal-binding protein